MTSFEIDPAISNFELEYVVNYMLYENNYLCRWKLETVINITISVDDN